MLVVFDVDGTLTRTVGLDAALFAQAVHDVHGIVMTDDDWRACPQVSDQGLAEYTLARRGNTARAAARAVKRRFLELLATGLGAPSPALRVAGAAEVFAGLARAGHRVAIATGCWEAAARLKLSRALVAHARVPFASSDDHPAREAILRMAIARGGAGAGTERVVYVGDGPWDVAATRRLGLPLVGVDHEGSGRLASLGVSHVVRDLADLDALVAALAAAVVPGAA
ncbi:MAG: haloacid dehalogenase-like hydrolase [Candidatus Binatia bacterium]